MCPDNSALRKPPRWLPADAVQEFEMRMILVAAGGIAAYSGRKVYLGERRDEMPYWMITYFVSFGLYAYTFIQLVRKELEQ